MLDSRDLLKSDISELRQYIKSTAKTANRMLAELERTSNDKASPAYRTINAMEFEGDKALRTLKSTDTARFRGDVSKMTKNELVHEAKLLKDFLGAKTSTPEGTFEMYEQGFETMQESGLIDGLSMNDYYDLIESTNFRNIENLSSDKAVKIATRGYNAGMSKEDIDKLLHTPDITMRKASARVRVFREARQRAEEGGRTRKDF